MVKKETVIEIIKKVFFNYIESEPESLPDIASVNKLLCKAINELPEDDGWIPVEERLPEIDGEYYPLVIVTLSTDETTAAFYRGDDEVWYIYREDWGECVEQVADEVVIAWKPFPMPYIQSPKSKCIPDSWIERTMGEFERVE